MEHSFKLIIIVSNLIFHYGYTKGTVTLSPPGVAPMCSGGQLELMCTITGGFLRWRFSVIRGFNDQFILTRTIQATVPDEYAMTQFVVNFTMFNFSRTTAEDSLPVMSKLVIGPVSSGLNGTVINCIDSDTSDSASTTIIIIERKQLQGLSVREQHVEFGMEVTITLEWDELNPLYSINITVMPETQANISSNTAHLTVAYNMMYNVSIMVSHPCGQNSVAVFSEEYYYPHTITSNNFCGSPEELMSESVIVSGYNPPAVEGTNMTFHCPPGLALEGIKSSTCMENGEWEPSLYKIYCSAAGPGGSFSGLTNEGKIAVASAVTAFVIGSVLFVIGFLCRHFCRKEKETTQLQTGTITQCEKTQGAPYYDDVVIKQHEQELELKENVAYAPVF